jgi:nucleotide-binding universal stress UspA family protein
VAGSNRTAVIADALPRRSLVVPLSGTKQSGAAIPHAVDILAQRGAESELVLLHVVDAPYISVTRAALDDLDAHRSEMKTYLEDLARPIRESGLVVRTEVLSGDPAQAIIDYLKGNPTQLLVMATRGKSRLNRTIFGSVTESVIHMVKVTPLLLVGGEE